MISGRTFILTLLVISFGAQAQAPGYMGKRTVGGYGFYINPAISAALLDYGTKVINTQHEFFLERSVKKGLALGVSLKLYRTTYNNTGDVDMSTFFYQHGIQEVNGTVDIKPHGSVSIKGRNFAFYLKLYKKGYVAPWGKYFLVGLTLNQRQCSYNPDEMNVDYTVLIQNYNFPYGSLTQTLTYNNFGATDQVYDYPDLMIGGGNSRVFWKKMVLDYGYNINVMAFTIGAVDALDSYTPAPEKYIRTNSAMRVRGINRFNFFVKLGYLF